MKKIVFITLIILANFNHQTALAQKTNMEISGDVLQFALPLTALASTYYYQGNDKPHWQFLKAYSASIVFTHSIKHIINKQRPNGGNYSFPSGHTTSAFSGATFLQIRYGWKIGVPAFLLASYVGYTRVKASKHDKWDVLGGALVGIGGALLFVKPYHISNMSNSRLSNINRFSIGVNNPIMFGSTKSKASILLNKVERYYIVGIHYQF